MSHQVQYKELRVSQLCESPSLLLMFHPIHQQSVAQTYAVFTMSCPVLTKHPVVTEHLYKQRILQLGPSNSPDVSVRNAALWFHHIHVPASQPPFWKWWFLLDDDKPYYKKLVVRKPTSRKWWLDFQGNSIPKMTHTHTQLQFFPNNDDIFRLLFYHHLRGDEGIVLEDFYALYEILGCERNWRVRAGSLKRRARLSQHAPKSLYLKI